MWPTIAESSLILKKKAKRLQKIPRRNFRAFDFSLSDDVKVRDLFCPDKIKFVSDQFYFGL